MTNYFKNILEKLKTFFIKKKKLTIASIIIIIFALFFFNKNETSIAVGQLEFGNLEEIVSVSGTVYANEESALSFEKSGKISSITVKVGDYVKAGQVLATLSQGSDYASVLNASANLSAAEANLEDAKNGASSAELAVKEQTLSSARANLYSANSSAEDALRSTHSTLSDIAGYKTGNIFTYNLSYKLKFNSCDQAFQANIESQRGVLDNKLALLSDLIKNFSLYNISDQAEINKKIDEAGEKAYNTSIFLLDLLNNIDKVLNLPCSISDASLDTYRSTISSARSTLNTAISNLTSLRSQIVSYRNSLASAEALLNEAKASASPEKLKSLEANVSAARANLLSAQSVNAKNLIIAPFEGRVTHVNLNLGEISSPNTPAIKIISANNLQLKIKLSEIDLIKVKPGDKAKVYLDTYGDTVAFEGVVSQVDPAATLDGNSSSYYAKIDFTSKDDRVRPGMNGSSDIVTTEKQGINYISANYVKIDGQEVKVKIIKDISKLSKTTSNDNDSNIVWRTISIGVRGTDGKIEVLSGIGKEDKLFPIGLEALDKKS